MFKDTKYFSRLADHFTKYGHYPYQDEWNDLIASLNKKNKGKTKIMPTYDMMSYDAQKFADEWLDIFIQGDKSPSGVPITGEHSFYLNIVQIEIIEKLKRKQTDLEEKSGRTIAKRKVFFPRFWDEDFRYFWTCDIARYGITRKKLDRIQTLGMNLGLVETDENLAGGLNHLYLKPRGVGASWKAGAWNCYNLYLVPDTKNFIFADNDQFLGDNDGIFSKFVSIRDFIQSNVWFLWKHFSKESPSERIFETGLKDSTFGSSTTDGFNTSVGGVIIEKKPQKARGKRGNGTFEEFGSFPEVAQTWNVFDSSMRSSGDVFAQARGFGTGGDKDANYEDLEKMFRDPETYRIIKFLNTYEENAIDAPIAMFTPAWINPTDIDEHGNSLIDEAKAKWEKEIEIKKKATDPTALPAFLAEKPGEPNHSFNSVGINILPVELAKIQLNKLKIQELDRTACTYGNLEYKEGGGIKMVPVDMLPYEAFPVKHKHDKEGIPAIFTLPFKMGGVVPKDLYRIAVDAYTHAESAHSESLMDIRVIENKNPFTPYKGDIIAAWYRGRPEGSNGQDKACDILFKFAEMYNCINAVAVENDQPGNTIAYAKLHTDSRGRKLTQYLADQFELNVINEGGRNIKTAASMKRLYGINMNPARKEEGMKYLQEWLLRERKTIRNSNGVQEVIRNIDLIMDRGFLNEIIKYNGGNADAISSMIVAQYHEIELKTLNRYAGKTKKQDRFFSEALFN